MQKILVLSADLVTLRIFNESESRIFGPLTKSRPNYLGDRDKFESSKNLLSRIFGPSDQIFVDYLGSSRPTTNLRRIFSQNVGSLDQFCYVYLRSIRQRTSELRNVSTSRIQNNPFSTGFPNSFDVGQRQWSFFR
jgi:hypothetical protein